MSKYVLDIRIDLVFDAGLLRSQVNESHMVIAVRPAPPKLLVDISGVLYQSIAIKRIGIARVSTVDLGMPR